MSEKKQILTASVIGLLATTALLIIYTLIVVAVSGWLFAGLQFISTWYFIVSLAMGFGLQVGLYTYLKLSITQMHTSGKVMAVSGTTSTVAMVACCAHYLANVAPLLGLASVISLIGQYQRQLFWVGILFNFFGIIYLVSKIVHFKKYEPPTPQSNIT